MKKIDYGKGLWAQIKDVPPMVFPPENRLTEKGLKEAFENLFQDTKFTPQRPMMEVTGGLMLSLDDEAFIEFYQADYIRCLTGVEAFNKIKERAKKLGLE